MGKRKIKAQIARYLGEDQHERQSEANAAATVWAVVVERAGSHGGGQCDGQLSRSALVARRSLARGGVGLQTGQQRADEVNIPLRARRTPLQFSRPCSALSIVNTTTGLLH